ncbi:hypothetical protein O7631_10465 [Micromonospora sp. WMMD967]|uniref:hypothetical protein n=1 Tax=Micromonospora sp. WMMD967 TaxID=3016101 RepID=UPI0024175F6D|nr:hypothetical protein [Micromonospora sp. WMMD967]MDG4836938.1 hypothetical protein [Micromonospora sp. WMMD967]
MSGRAYPYRTASNHVSADPWVHTDDGVAAADHLPSWDYGTLLHFSRRVTVEMTALLTACGFDGPVSLAMNVRYWPSTSLVRRSATHVPLQYDDLSRQIETILEVEIPGTDLAGALTLETTIVLAASVGDAPPFVARRPGSVLWRDQTSIRLEGNAGLLPVAPVSFKTQGLPEQAAWYVSVDSAEWSSAAMGNLLVLLNDDNDQVSEAVRKPKDPQAVVLWDALTVDVVYDLVGRALEDDEFPSEEEVKDDWEVTTAALVHGLIRAFLKMPNETLADATDRLREERRRDPSRLRASVQSNLLFPGGRTS